MSLKADLVKNYLDRLQAFDPEEDSVQVLESARRFIRQHTGKAVAPEIRETINQIHDELERIVSDSLTRTDLKAAFVELARKYDEENVLSEERAAPTVAPIKEDRLRLVTNATYDPTLYDGSQRHSETPPHAGRTGSTGQDPGNHGRDGEGEGHPLLPEGGSGSERGTG
jgi:hypothetical protein